MDQSMRRTWSAALMLAAAAAALSAAAALAQDWVQSAPQGKTVKLDNAHVRVVEVVVAAGGKEPEHTHPANVAYLLTAGKVKVSYKDGPTQVMEAKAGDALWSDPEGPHTLENVGKKPVRFLLIELKDLPYAAPPAKP